MSTYCTMLTLYASVLTLVGGTYVAAEIWWTHGPRKGGER